MTASQPRPSGAHPLFSPQPPASPNVVDARNPDSVLFSVKELEEANAEREASAREGVGSGLIDVKSLVSDVDAVAVEPTGTLIDQVRSQAAAQDVDDEIARPSRILPFMLVVLTLAVAGLAIAALRPF